MTLFSSIQNTTSQPAEITFIQLLPIIISSLALAFSIITLFFNYYIQYRKKPVLSILVSDKLKSWLGNESKLISNSTITIFNKGAQYGAVYKMRAELVHQESKEKTNLEWNMFVQDKNIGEMGKQFKSHTSFESWAETIVIQGRTALTKKIQFRSIENFELQIGNYLLTFYIFSGTDKKHSCSVIKKIKVVQDDLPKWQETIKNFDSENLVAKSSLVFKLSD